MPFFCRVCFEFFLLFKMRKNSYNVEEVLFLLYIFATESSPFCSAQWKGCGLEGSSRLGNVYVKI